MSVTFRDMANNKVNKHQWIVLDGDIDAEWIESMNTVMDDNKMLTLASNERIPLTPSMRLLLEINHMNHCSPATVSRGGVIYVNAEDVGWKPVVDSWIEKLEAAEYRPLLTTLFTRYVDPTLEHCRRNFKHVVPLPPVNQVMTVCKILEGILPTVSRGVRRAPCGFLAVVLSDVLRLISCHKNTKRTFSLFFVAAGVCARRTSP